MDEFSSLHHTLLTLLPPQSPCDFTYRRVHWTWLGLMPWPRPLLLSTSICLMDHGGLDRGPCLLPTVYTLSYSLRIMEVWIVVHAYYQLFIHFHIHWMCCNSVIIPSLHMSSIASVHPEEGSSSVALLKVYSLFFPVKVFFSVSWEFFLIRCEDRDVLCTDCLALWG